MKYKKEYFVYIMASVTSVLYVGVTNNIYRRVLDHKSGFIDSFQKNINVKNWSIMKVEIIYV